MIVETTLMAKCGEGTPMFSRRGKSTSVQYMVFNTPNMVAESSFKKEQREKEGGFRNNKISELDTIFEQFNVKSILLLILFH